MLRSETKTTTDQVEKKKDIGASRRQYIEALCVEVFTSIPLRRGLGREARVEMPTEEDEEEGKGDDRVEG